MQNQIEAWAESLVRGLDSETDPFVSVIAGDGRYEADFGECEGGRFLLRGETDEYQCLTAELVFVDEAGAEHHPVLAPELQNRLEELATEVDLKKTERLSFRR